MSLLKKMIRISVFAAVALVVVALSWASMDTGIHATSDYEFCTSCHSHQPLATSYREDLHGGNNSAGWRATCSDCHISHKNSLSYLWVKGIHGVVDPTMELMKEPHEIDWHENRSRREHYVYDSGCLQCHKYLKERTQANRRSFLPHRAYFAEGQKGMTCVGCHQHVGHSNLGIHLKEQGWETQDEN